MLKKDRHLGGIQHSEPIDVALLGWAGERDLGICGAEIGSHDAGLSVQRAHRTSDVRRSQWKPEGFWEFTMPRSAVFTHETPQMPQSGCHPSLFHSNDSSKWFTTQWVVSLYDCSYWFNSLERIFKSCLNSESYLAWKWTLFLYYISYTRSEIIEEFKWLKRWIKLRDRLLSFFIMWPKCLANWLKIHCGVSVRWMYELRCIQSASSQRLSDSRQSSLLSCRSIRPLELNYPAAPVQVSDEPIHPHQINTN